MVGLTAIVGFLATGGRKCPERADPLPALWELMVRLVLALAPAGVGFCCGIVGDLCSAGGLPPLPCARQCKLLGLKQFLHSPGFHTCSVKVLQADMAAGPVRQRAESVDRKPLHEATGYSN